MAWCVPPPLSFFLPARHRIDVLDGPRQRHRGPCLAAVARGEDLAVVAGTDTDLPRVGRMQRNRHDGAVHLHLVEALPRAAGVLAAIDAAVVARRLPAHRRTNSPRALGWHPS